MTSLNVFVFDRLPLEEALFVFITTAMVVMAGACYDKAYGTIVSFTLIYPHQFSISTKFICQMFKAFAISEYSLPSIVTEDLISNLKSMDNANIMPINAYLLSISLRYKLILIIQYTDNITATLRPSLYRCGFRRNIIIFYRGYMVTEYDVPRID